MSGAKFIAETEIPQVLADNTTIILPPDNPPSQEIPFSKATRKNATAPRKESPQKIEIGQPVREVHGAQLNLAEETGTEYYVVGKRPLKGMNDIYESQTFDIQLEHRQFFKSDGSNVGLSPEAGQGNILYVDLGENLEAYEYAHTEKYDAKYMDRA